MGFGKQSNRRSAGDEFDPRCVCGDKLSDHVLASASVPIAAPMDPVYGFPSYSPILRTFPGSSYEQDQCHCGCTIFTHDRCQFRVSTGEDSSGSCRWNEGHAGEHAAA